MLAKKYILSILMLLYCVAALIFFIKIGVDFNWRTILSFLGFVLAGLLTFLFVNRLMK